MKISFSDLARAMDSSDKSLRMKAAMTAGTYPDPDFIELLISQCASEVDFFVRDTLSWALIRQDRDVVFQRLKHELYSVNPQSVSQALHTFTKLDDASAWTLITREFLLNEDERIAQTAWRAASRFVPVRCKIGFAPSFCDSAWPRGFRDANKSQQSNLCFGVGRNASD